MTSILLINPGAVEEIYGKLSVLTACEPPLWCRLLGGYLVDRGFEVKVLDAVAEQLTPHQVADRVQQLKPNLVALVVCGHQPSASTQQMVGAGKEARAIKALVPEQKVVMLGNHPSALPVRTLQEEAVDWVIDGEGPRSLEGLLNETPLPEIPGLVWKERGLTRRNPLASLLNLDALHGQIWDRLPLKQYTAHNWHCFEGSLRQPYAAVYTTLGCSFRCSFCMINVFQHSNQYRLRSPAAVVEEITNLYNRYGMKVIKVIDEMFCLNRQHVKDICDGLIERGLESHLNMWAYARVDTVKDEEMLALMHRAGFRWLGIGVESGSKHVRDGVEKGRFGNEEIIEAVHRVQRYGIHVAANYIFGLPDDTEESCKETLALACELNTEWANFYCAMAYPGSPLHRIAQEKGWRLPEDPGGPGWIGYSQHAYESLPLPTATLTSEQVLDIRDNAFMHYFTRPAYLDMMQVRFGGHAVEQVEHMIAFGKPRRKHHDL